MKFHSVVSSLLAVSAPIMLANAAPTASPDFNPADMLGLLMGGGSKAPLQVDTKIPLSQEIPAEGGEPGAKRVRIRYGPWRMPTYTEQTMTSRLTKEGGMYDAFGKDMQKPCTDCVVTRFKGNLVYPDGSEANVNTGAWTHHFISFMTGPNRHALGCGQMIGKNAEPFYTFGNERLPMYFDNTGATKSGYYISKEDKMSAIVELMNMADTPKDVFLTIEYEYLPGKPAGYVDAEPMWLAMCELGQVKPPANTTSDSGSFVLRSKDMPSPIEGPILLIGGHVHDGGTHVELFINEKMVCDSITSYGQRPEFIQTDSKASGLYLMKGMSNMDTLVKTGLKHISDQTQCHNIGNLKKGDNLRLNAYYDFSKENGLTNLEGKMADVMGLGMLYVGRPLPSS